MPNPNLGDMSPQQHINVEKFMRVLERTAGERLSKEDTETFMGQINKTVSEAGYKVEGEGWVMIRKD